MNSRQPVLNARQSTSFDRFLLGGTGKILNALETMFELDIEKSESLIEIAAANESSALRSVSNGPLYTVSSELMGALRGQVQLLVHSSDLYYLGELLKPVLSLLFLSRPETDLKTLDSQKPGWMADQDTPAMEDAEFHAQMMDVLAEMGNVLIGLYSRSIYEMSALRTQHALPRIEQTTLISTVQGILDRDGIHDQPRLIIDHLFLIAGVPFHLWCVISLVPESFEDLLRGIDACSEREAPVPVSPRFAQNRLGG
jgi:hypothetical protein